MLDPGWAGPVGGQSQEAWGRLSRVVAKDAGEKSVPPSGARK
jgi:hypothetical protein